MSTQSWQHVLWAGLLWVTPVMSAPTPAERVEVLNLAGLWTFRLDPQNVGEQERWQNTYLPDPIKLPGTTDEAGYGTKTTGSDPGFLTRVHKYYGPAWYQRDIEIPAPWKDKEVELLLERVLWESKVWVNDRPAGRHDSLNTPHVFQLGRLPPGKHRLTVRISNLMIHPISTWGHCFTEQTQTIWNGIVGRIELRARDPLRLGLVRTFPKAEERKLDVEVSLLNGAGASRQGTLTYVLRDQPSGKVFAQNESSFSIPSAGAGVSEVHHTFALPAAPKLWDEFEPALYRLEVRLETDGVRDRREVTLGFRTLNRSGQHIAINGRPAFFRGNLDCVHFPLTGYPPTDAKSWRRLFQIYQDHGLNHVRFHSWTPPEAAFVAADELGLYLQCEVVWTQRRLGRDQPGPVENPKGDYPDSFHNPPGTVDGYVRVEMRRVLDTYGNHPSFVLFTIGNELGGSDFKATGEWIREEKKRDPRRLYAASTARAITPYCDFNATHAIPQVGQCRDRVEPFNDWDYESVYRKAPVPIIAHEVGQWPTYPEWNEIGKYKGVVRARNLEDFRTLAQQKGIAGQAKDLRVASGALALRLYKDQIESHLRTPSCSGFQLLSMQDFSGQGEALVGWLDSFYDSKGLVSAKRFRRWCNATVPLARLPKYVFTAGETLTGRVEVAHYGPRALTNVTAVWRLLDANGKALAEGKLAKASLPTGTVTPLGLLEAALNRCEPPCQARLEVTLEGTGFANDWDLWVLPEKSEAAAPADVLVCEAVEAAVAALGQGRKVLLLAHTLGERRNTLLANFKPVYWSASFFPWSETLGALVQSRHPALAQFPTENHLDWQWHSLCKGARGFLLNELPASIRPIVQPVSDFHFNHKLGSLFEFRTREGGKLLVCGYNLADDLAQRPEARQLRHSLLTYMAGPKFAPKQELSTDSLKSIFPDVKEAPAAAPPDFTKAVLHVKAGRKHPGRGNVAWKTEVDEAKFAEKGFAYRVTCDGVWRDETGTAWQAKRLLVEIEVPQATIYDFYAHFRDWNRNNRSGTLTFEGRKFALGDHDGSGRWVKIDVQRAHCTDGVLRLEADCESGPNLMITAIALVPRE